MLFRKLKSLAYNLNVYLKFLLGIPTPLNTPDRAFLELFLFDWVNNLQPKKILFVGVAYYTAHYRKRFSNCKFYTCEKRFTPYALKNHFRCPIQNIASKTSIRFDCIFLNGVIGFGLNDIDQIETSLLQIYSQLNLGGHLIIGVNDLSFVKSLLLDESAKFRHHFLVITELPGFRTGYYLANPANNHTFIVCKKSALL